MTPAKTAKPRKVFPTNGTAPAKIQPSDLNEVTYKAFMAWMEKNGKALNQKAGGKSTKSPSRHPTEQAVQIAIWEDDPFLEAVAGSQPVTAETITTDVPTNEHELLQTEILNEQPDAEVYDPNTSIREFLYWNAASALARGINFWAPILPDGTVWSCDTSPMQVELDAGVDLNAYYSRDSGLNFFHEQVVGNMVFSGDSPDVVCHELGHAILDALKPELFNTTSNEVAAFHESFGDMSGMLSALQLPTMREFVIEQTGGDLSLNSRLSQMARELGWAIRRSFGSDSADSDCLRNASNSFFYQDPVTLPSNAPANMLSAEPHSFSRVFTGAFLDVLAGMFEVGPATSTSDDSDKLAAVANDAGKLLVEAVRVASISPGYYSHVAAGMIQADQSLFAGRYTAALTTSFVRRGILSPESGVSLVRELRVNSAAAFGITSVGRAKALHFQGDNEGYKKSGADAPELPLRLLSTRFGVTFNVHMPSETSRFSVSAAAVAGGSEENTSTEEDARAFVEDLIQQGRIAEGDVTGVIPTELIPPGEPYPSDQTHELVKQDGKVVLKRRHFDCGYCSRHSR